ncbi:MAG: RNA-processing protein, partial [Candidatus Diapherotrites archaeon]|nr:RNA-processing protein [Candidatus Diapherotrites archaeon]
EVFFTPKEKASDFLSAMNMVKAIGRGFSPENAMLLLDNETFLSIIDLQEFGKTKKKLFTRKGRVIGEKGRIRERIEEATDTKISVYGKTISIIGRVQGIEAAKTAVEMLLEGARHDTVFKFLRDITMEKTKFEL